MKIEKCPRCERKGSVHAKWVLNEDHKKYEPYYYVAHYNPETRKIKWCYISRDSAHALMGTLPNTAKEETMKKVIEIIRREGGIVILELVAEELKIPVEQAKEAFEMLRQEGNLYSQKDLDNLYKARKIK